LLDSAAAITAAVDRITAFSKRMTIFGADLKPQSEPLDVDVLIGACWAPLKSRAETVNVQFSAEPSNLTLNADRMMLEESLSCLFSNALDAIEDRQNDAETIRQDEISVTVDGVVGARTRISVRDTGIGFGEDIADRLFLPFFTTKTDRRFAETPSFHEGIGLFTVRRFMRLHGGDVSAQSPGSYLGATFTLDFPNSE
jgi:signal transduction histidine kinase